MSDTTLNAFVAQGTDAERIAFTPVPPTPASGPDSGYYFFVNDTTPQKLYAWDSAGAAWVLVSSGGSGILPATVQGDMLYASGANTIAALAKNASATRYLSNTGTTNNPAWAQVVLTNGVSGILPVANGGTGSASGATILKASNTITNTEYLAMVTAGKTLISAPGAGFTINFIQAYLLADFSAGAYTGAAVGGSSLQLQIGTSVVSNYIVNDNTGTPSISYLSTFNNNTKKRVLLGINTDLTTVANGWGALVPVVTNFTGDNTALSMTALNGGVDFGGGNAANTLKWVVYYTIEATT